MTGNAQGQDGFGYGPDPSYRTGAIVYHAEVNPMPKAGGKWSTMVTIKPL